MFDKLIRGGIAVLPEGIKKADIAIRAGKIAGILESSDACAARETIDASGLYILPGAIDAHTHFFDPGANYREDWAHGTREAARGGFTCVMEMPNSDPAVTTPEKFAVKYDLAKRQAVIDYAIWGGATADHLDQLEALRGLGVVAFKGFTLYSGEEFRCLNREMQREAMQRIAPMGRVLAFHAEDPDMVGERTARLQKTLPWNLKLHDEARPYISELSAIAGVLLLARETGCPIHICHLSIPEGAELIRRAKADGVDVSVESCAHYFVLNHEDNFDAGPYALIQPPLRNRARMEGLWQYLLDGTIDMLSTDHAPYTREDKEPDDGDGWKVMGGIPSLGVAYMLMLDEAVKKRGMTLDAFARVSATNAARRFGLSSRKGSLRLGAEADIVIVDMYESWAYHARDSYSKSQCDKFPYENRRIGCRVKKTLVRGEVVYDGDIRVKEGYGNFIKPKEKG